MLKLFADPRIRRLVFIVPVVVLVALGINLALLLNTDRNRTLLPSALIGKPAPATELMALAGLDGVDGISSADFAGQVTIVNFFASWCLPCLAEHKLIADLTARGYHVWGIDYRDEEPKGLEWLIRNGNPYERVGADPNARAGFDWGLTGVPETFIIDRAGIVRYAHPGPLSPRDIERKIMPVLRELTAEALS